MKNPTFSRNRALGLLAALAIGAHGASAVFAQEAEPPQAAGVQGGLVLQIGAGDVGQAAKLSQTGRFVIHVIDTDAAAISKAQQLLRANGRYGLVWAEHRENFDRLPYAENVVNAIVIASDAAVAEEELFRVLTPGGKLQKPDGKISVKPWPESMDGWSHPRHGSGGNAVSKDTAVGPPERVRWVAAATWEVEGLVSGGGRNFYGGILARDSFNGLRLWHRDLAKGDDPNSGDFKLPRLPGDGARPVAGEQLLFAILKGKVVAIDAASGEVKHEFPGVEQPRALLNHDDRVVAAGAGAVHGFNAATGEQLWKIDATEPHNVVAGNDLVSFIHGRPKRGEKSEAVMLNLHTGKEQWRSNGFAWLDRTTRTVLYENHLAFEVSTLNDHDDGNAIYLVDAQTGNFAWEKAYAPGMNHARQARAMFLDNAMWILHGGKVGTQTDKAGRVPVEVSALELATGEVMVTHSAGLAHCFPPVATPNYMFAGELDLTNLETGDVVANRITKANCSRENGWVPANGLIYTTPKHCTCWPMLRGFVAMAPAAAEANPAMKPVDEIEFKLEFGPAAAPTGPATAPAPGDWPSYRNDKWRSGSTSTAGPAKLELAWKTKLIPDAEAAERANPPKGPILHDWRENPYVKGPLTQPIVAGGVAYLARPDAHEVLAVKTDGSGEVAWRVTVNGRVDTPPTYHNGLVLFGTHSGSVSALRADNGEQVWRLNAAPTDERIVAYGQVESPWPVPGSILIDENVAYFVAGRQELADGGVSVFAVDPMTGQKHWVHRIDDVPQQGFYENSGLEFDPVDIPFVEGDKIAMSRWLISKDGKERTVDKWNAFAKLDVDGEGSAWAPRGFWTYGARHQYRFAGEAPNRPLCAFRGGNLIGQLDGSTDVFLRDFDLENGEEFDSKWITGWSAAGSARKGEKPYRNYRLAEKAKWTVDPFTPAEEKKELPIGTQVWNDVHGVVLAGDGRAFLAHKDGRIVALNVADGAVLAQTQVDEPIWDSLILAGGKLFLTTMTGELVCVGG